MSTPSPAPRGSHDALRHVVVILWSTVAWVFLWGDLTFANVLWGAVLGALTVVILPIQHRQHRLPVRPVAALRFLGVFAWELVKANAVVAWEIVTPGSRINQGIVAIPLRTHSPGLMTLIGNAVSLTPGTLTLETRLDPPTLYVHVLHLRDVEDVRADVHRFERLAMAAFGQDPDPGPLPGHGPAEPATDHQTGEG